MTRKKQDSVLDLAPLPQKVESSNIIFYDPFDGVYPTLTKEEKKIVDAWRQQALVTRAQALKGALAGRAMGELVEEATEEFTQTSLALELYKDIARGTESEPYVEEFIHRQKQLLARHEEEVVNIAAATIKAEVGQTVTAVAATLSEPEERKTFFQRLSYLITGK